MVGQRRPSVASKALSTDMNHCHIHPNLLYTSELKEGDEQSSGNPPI
jgi:hypothetical protein